MSGCNVFSELLLHSVQFQALRWCIVSKPALHRAYWCGFRFQQHETGKLHLSTLLLSLSFIFFKVYISCPRTFPHTFFAISAYRISLLCPFILLFSSLIPTVLSHPTAENLCFVWSVCVCVCVIKYIKTQSQTAMTPFLIDCQGVFLQIPADYRTGAQCTLSSERWWNTVYKRNNKYSFISVI